MTHLHLPDIHVRGNSDVRRRGEITYWLGHVDPEAAAAVATRPGDVTDANMGEQLHWQVIGHDDGQRPEVDVGAHVVRKTLELARCRAERRTIEAPEIQHCITAGELVLRAGRAHDRSWHPPRVYVVSHVVWHGGNKCCCDGERYGDGHQPPCPSDEST